MPAEPPIRNPRAAADPVAYMDAVRDSPAGRRYKRRALALLDLAPGQRLLDLGAGPGDDARRFASRLGPRGRVIGIDHHRLMAETARQRAHAAGDARCRFLQADAGLLPFPPASFDRVYADRVLQLLRGRQSQVLARLRPLLRSGGRVLVCDPDPASFRLDVGEPEPTRAILDHLVRSAPWSPAATRTALQETGWTQIVQEESRDETADFARVDAVTPLGFLAEGARRAGALSDDEHRRWTGALAQAVAARTFRFASSMVITLATQPG